MQLYERVRELAKTKEHSVTALSDKLKIQQATFNGYLKESRQHNLWAILPDILNLYPDISKYWLYFGEGEMLDANPRPATKKPLSCENHKGLLIGDLLHVVFGFLDLDIAKAAKKTKIPLARLEILLASADMPTFLELEALHVKLGIRARYLFDGNEHHMHIPTDPLLRVYYALGLQGRTPTYRQIEEFFDVEKEDAKDFLKDWKEARARNTDRSLPMGWLESLEERHDFTASWIMSDNPPLIRKRQERHDSKLFIKYEAVLKENSDLREKLAAITGEIQSTSKGA